MPISEQDEHLRLIEQTRRKMYKKRVKRGKWRAKNAAKKKRSKIAKQIDRLPTRELWASLGRRSAKVKKMKTTPEELAAAAKHARVTRALRARYCDHAKFPPRKRKGGKNAGLWVCPSCDRPVPAPANVREEDLVT